MVVHLRQRTHWVSPLPGSRQGFTPCERETDARERERAFRIERKTRSRSSSRARPASLRSAPVAQWIERRSPDPKGCRCSGPTRFYSAVVQGSAGGPASRRRSKISTSPSGKNRSVELCRTSTGPPLPALLRGVWQASEDGAYRSDDSLRVLQLNVVADWNDLDATARHAGGELLLASLPDGFDPLLESSVGDGRSMVVRRSEHDQWHGWERAQGRDLRDDAGREAKAFVQPIAGRCRPQEEAAPRMTVMDRFASRSDAEPAGQRARTRSR